MNETSCVTYYTLREPRTGRFFKRQKLKKRCTANCYRCQKRVGFSGTEVFSNGIVKVKFVFQNLITQQNFPKRCEIRTK